MWYPAAAMIASALSASNQNAQLAALNTIYGLSGDDAAPALSGLYSFSQVSDKIERPAVQFRLSTVPTKTELLRAGRRDALIALTLEYLSKNIDDPRCWNHAGITAEAWIILLEQSEGLRFGALNYGITWQDDPIIEILPRDIEASPANVAARLRSQFIVRRMD